MGRDGNSNFYYELAMASGCPLNRGRGVVNISQDIMGGKT